MAERKRLQMHNEAVCEIRSDEYSLYRRPDFTGALFSKSKDDKEKQGEVPKYHVKDHHEPIISTEVFTAVQEKIQAVKDYNPETNRTGKVSCFSSKITCSVCGNHYVRYVNIWACFGKLKSRMKDCQNGNLMDSRLQKLCAEVLSMETFDPDVFVKTVHNVLIHPNGKATFTFYDGRVIESSILFFKPEQ